MELGESEPSQKRGLQLDGKERILRPPTSLGWDTESTGSGSCLQNYAVALNDPEEHGHF